MNEVAGNTYEYGRTYERGMGNGERETVNGEEKEEGTRNGERETRNGEEKEEEGATGNAVTGNAEGGAENGEEEEEEEEEKGVTCNVFPEQARGQRICFQPIYLPGHVVKCD